MAAVRSVFRNMSHFRQNLFAFVSNTSVFVKLICSVIILCHAFSYSEVMIPVLSVTPGYFLPPTFRIYSALTFCFIEFHIWEIIIDIIALFLCGKLIEPLWGNFEMFIYFGVVNTSVAIVTAFFYLFLYMCTSNTELLFNIHIHGLAGYIAALSIAVKQIMPEHLVFRSPIGKITNRNIPLSMLFISILLYLIGMIDGTYPTMYAAGFIISWTYLRFYQRHSNGTRGDMAESFSFANFFPTVLQPPIALLCNTIHSTLVKIGLCQKPVRKYDLRAPSAITLSLPGSDPHDIDRRREKALKALSERLNRAESLPGSLPVTAWNNQKQPLTSWSKSNKSVSIVMPEVSLPNNSASEAGPSAATAAVRVAVANLDQLQDDQHSSTVP